jgi:hypothetical protein
MFHGFDLAEVKAQLELESSTKKEEGDDVCGAGAALHPDD